MDVHIEIGALIGGIVTAVIAVAAYQTYRKSESWKAAEFASRQLELLSRNDELALCCRALDWGVGPLLVPRRYRELVPFTTFEHDLKMMVEALQPGLTASVRDNPRGLIYRYCFDEFLAFLERLYDFTELNLVRPSQLRGFKYWLDAMATPVYLTQDRTVLMHFICAFGYRKVLLLMRDLGTLSSDAFVEWNKQVGSRGLSGEP